MIPLSVNLLAHLTSSPQRRADILKEDDARSLFRWHAHFFIDTGRIDIASAQVATTPDSVHLYNQFFVLKKSHGEPRTPVTSARKFNFSTGRAVSARAALNIKCRIAASAYSPQRSAHKVMGFHNLCIGNVCEIPCFQAHQHTQGAENFKPNDVCFVTVWPIYFVTPVL